MAQEAHARRRPPARSAAGSAAQRQVRELAGVLPAAVSLRASGDGRAGGVGFGGEVTVKNPDQTLTMSDMTPGTSSAHRKFASPADGFASRAAAGLASPV